MREVCKGCSVYNLCDINKDINPITECPCYTCIVKPICVEGCPEYETLIDRVITIRNG